MAIPLIADTLRVREYKIQVYNEALGLIFAFFIFVKRGFSDFFQIPMTTFCLDAFQSHSIMTVIKEDLGQREVGHWEKKDVKKNNKERNIVMNVLSWKEMKCD